MTQTKLFSAYDSANDCYEMTLSSKELYDGEIITARQRAQFNKLEVGESITMKDHFTFTRVK